LRPFEEDFNLLNTMLTEMGAIVAQSVHRSVFSLIEKNEDYAHQVIRDESRIDQMEIQIDELATTLIVREQPVARDMRLVVVAIKVNTDLERMGDLAMTVVERSLGLMKLPPLAEKVDFAQIANLTESMVLGSLDAFVKRDVQIAHSVLTTDDAVDRERHKIQRQLVELMQRDASTIPTAIDYLLIARAIERIADHATNIAEEAIFLAQGIDVRHRVVEDEVA
jgi:phosphate transport system protein